MRDVFDQDRPMTLGAVKTATGLIGILLLVSGAVFSALGIGKIVSGHWLSGIGQVVFSVAVVLFLFLVVRLLGEILGALHRLNDRLIILGDDMRTTRTPVAGMNGTAGYKPDPSTQKDA